MKTTFKPGADQEAIYAVVGSNEITERVQQVIASEGACSVESFGQFDHPDYNTSDWNLSIFRINGELVAHSKDATTWRADDPEAFADLLEVYGAHGQYTHNTDPAGDVGYVLMRRLGAQEQWFSFTPQGRAAIDRPMDRLEGDWHGSRGRIYTELP